MIILFTTRMGRGRGREERERGRRRRGRGGRSLCTLLLIYKKIQFAITEI